MNKRKNPKADLEQRRMVFFVFGFALTLAATLMAVQYTTVETQRLTASTSHLLDIDVMSEVALVSFPKTPTKPIVTQPISKEFELVKELPQVEPGIEPVEPRFPDLELPFEFGGEGEGEGDGEVIDDVIHMRVEIMPHFASCENVVNPEIQEECTNQEIIRKISKTAKYPSHLRGTNIQGTVYLSFVVNKSGKVTNVKVERGVHKALDKEAVKAVESLPDFEPGIQQGKPAKVIYNIPVRFVLQ
ncbi:MAG: energy transducer TonB [Flavobacteriales bacterium]